MKAVATQTSNGTKLLAVARTEPGRCWLRPMDTVGPAENTKQAAVDLLTAGVCIQQLTTLSGGTPEAHGIAGPALEALGSAFVALCIDGAVQQDEEARAREQHSATMPR